MNGIEQQLAVYLGSESIATLQLVDEQLRWQYTDNWQHVGYAISPHLPLERDIPSVNVQRFLRNLLPEGAPLEALLDYFHLSKYNTFGLIRTLGLDLPGALVVLPSRQSPPLNHSFRPIKPLELERRLALHDESGLMIWDSKPRLSVAGVQDKINIFMRDNGDIGFAEGGLCSTHLLKFERKKQSHLVLNEYVTMQLAKRCDLPVADVKLVHFGEYPALLIERFDRKFISNDEVKRRHMIDGCQALNLSPDNKYERNFGSARDVAHIRDGASLVLLFDFTSQCVEPAAAKQQMLDWVLFNVLVYNVDAHGKNISFFVGEAGISLTPFYDLVNIKMYPDFEQEMAMALGDEFDVNAVNAYQLADFAQSCQLPRALLVRRLTMLIEKLSTALEDVIGNGAGDAVLFTGAQQKIFLQQYQQIIMARCAHLSAQVELLATIEL